MEDDKIKELFNSYNPKLSPGNRFMARLERNMAAVEDVKRQAVARRCYNTIAVVVASIVGFVTGVLLTLVYPLAGKWLAGADFSIPGLGVSVMSLDWQIACWVVMVVVCALAAINAYELTLSRLSARKQPR